MISLGKKYTLAWFGYFYSQKSILVLLASSSQIWFQLFLKLGNFFYVISCDNHIIHLDYQGSNLSLFMLKKTKRKKIYMIWVTLLKTIFSHSQAKTTKPCSRWLFQFICSLQLTYYSNALWCNVINWNIHIHLLLKVSMKKGILHIELVQRPI